MRRVLFATIALVLLLSTFGTAFAGDDIAVLGDVWSFWGWGWEPFERVDTYLYRPPAICDWDEVAGMCDPAGYPFVGGPLVGEWWWTGPDSEIRRQSWPTYQFADDLGFYFTEFMLPRDEVWFPCSYPYKWNCNYWYFTTPITDPLREYHSPWWQGDFEAGLAWPWYDWPIFRDTLDFEAAWLAANPMDTVSPLVVFMSGEFSGDSLPLELDVIGYYWKWTDLEDGFYWVPFP